MNGVRRFFATANSKPPSSPSGSEPLQATSDTQTDPSEPIPLLVNNPEKQTSSSPSVINDQGLSNPHPYAPLSVQTHKTPALVIRKEDSSLPILRKNEFHLNGGTELPPSNSSAIHNASVSSTQNLPDTLGSDFEPTSTRYMNTPSTPLVSTSSLGQLNSKLTIRDDLFLSLLTSEALVDSRGYEFLTAEEVERLKQEQQLLASRAGAVKRKLGLELKIRKASHNLQKLRASKDHSDSIDGKDSAGTKLDAINSELIQTLEKLFDVDRTLLRHQSAVLGQSIRILEKQSNLDNYPSSSNITEVLTSPGTHTRSSSSATSSSIRIKFEGAHLFAGHAHSILPASHLSSRHNQSSDRHHITSLEEKLNISNETKKFVEMKLASLEEETRQLRQQNIELGKYHELQLRNATDMIRDLEKRLNESPDPLQIQELQERQRKEWDNERKQWDFDRENWNKLEQSWKLDRQMLDDSIKSQRDMLSSLERNIEDLEAIKLEKDNLNQLFMQKDNELRRINELIERDRASWEAERIRLKEEIQQTQNVFFDARSNERANEALSELRDILEELVDLHEIPRNPQDTGTLTLMSSVRNHLTLLTARLKSVAEEKGGLEDQIRIYERDLHKSNQIHEQLRQELDEVRRSSNETDMPMSKVKELSEPPEEPPEAHPHFSDSRWTVTGSNEYSRVVHLLQGLWAILPSVESRAAKLPKGGSMSPVSPAMASSLSDLDVRSLKSLYDSKQGFVSPVVFGQFSIEEFVRRVHALINDDRALIERLLRFAQSHDLLRNNAERAQKLAQESNKGLELYQAQLRTLEERNTTLTRKQLTMLDEISNLQQSLDIVMREKHTLEVETIDQASTIQRLTEANNVLSSRSLAEGNKPMAIKAKLEAQLSEMRAKLLEAQNEADQLRSIESSQRIALLDELNSLQQENNQLREQLRNKK